MERRKDMFPKVYALGRTWLVKKGRVTISQVYVLLLNAVIWMLYKWVFVLFMRFIDKSLKKQSLKCWYLCNSPPLSNLPSEPSIEALASCLAIIWWSRWRTNPLGDWPSKVAVHILALTAFPLPWHSTAQMSLTCSVLSWHGSWPSKDLPVWKPVGSLILQHQIITIVLFHQSCWKLPVVSND